MRTSSALTCATAPSPAAFLLLALVLVVTTTTSCSRSGLCFFVDAWSSSTSSSFVASSSSRSFFQGSSGRAATGAAPLAMQTPVLNNWKVLRNGRVVGTVRNHPSIPDGDIITTSPIQQPELADRQKVITTKSGSKYQLGEPVFESRNGKPVSIPELKRQAKVEKGLNGDVVGSDDAMYLLCGRPTRSTSRKSNLYTAYRADDDGLPTGEPVLIKLSRNYEAIERENDNYGKITKKGINRGQFVKLFDYIANVSDKGKFRNQSALVLERGTCDLKRYVKENGMLDGKELRDAAAAAAQCLQAVHSSGLVWTDMKTENFVVGEDGTFKGIDLESAMPVRGNPVDYSPEATPPEFARAFLAGEGPYFPLDYNYDLWSFGMMLYELATGRGYFDGKTPLVITKLLEQGPEVELDLVENPQLRDLIKQCLQLNPRSRPNILQVLLHPYFLTSGFGPISFGS